MLFTSALTGDGVDGIIPAAMKAGDSWRAMFQTAQLNRILAEATAAMDPPRSDRRRLKLMYVTQVGSAPPRLAIFHQRRTRHSGALPALPRHAISHSAGTGRHAAPADFRRTGRTWAKARATGDGGAASLATGPAPRNQTGAARRVALVEASSATAFRTPRRVRYISVSRQFP